MKTIILSLLLLQGCVSLSIGAEQIEYLPFVSSATLVASYPTVEMYEKLEARIKALEETCLQVSTTTFPNNFYRTLFTIPTDTEVISDEEFIRKGKEDVEKMKEVQK